METVAKEEFDAWRAAYPEGLQGMRWNTSEPPVTLFKDAAGTIVGKILWWTDMSAHPAYKGEPDEYRIQRAPCPPS